MWIECEPLKLNENDYFSVSFVLFQREGDMSFFCVCVCAQDQKKSLVCEHLSYPHFIALLHRSQNGKAFHWLSQVFHTILPEMPFFLS